MRKKNIDVLVVCTDFNESFTELNKKGLTNYPFFSVMSAASMFTIFLLVSSVKDLFRLYSFIMLSPPGFLVKMVSTNYKQRGRKKG